MIRNLRGSNPDLPDRCQVCVIGSGAGGAVVAAELAEAGFDVVVLEEGGYYPTSELSHDPLRMLPRLYRNAGGDSTLGRAPIMYTEGRCVGGSTVINAGVCYRTPSDVLHRWAMGLGTLDFMPENLAPIFEQVEKRLHVSPVPEELYSKDAKFMLEAAQGKNYHSVPVLRNIHACQGTNMCILGCPTGAKQSTLVTYLPRAEKAGARIFANCRVQKIELDGDRAAGVEYHNLDPLTGKRGPSRFLQADWVFVAAGGTQSPSILFRSGIARKLRFVGKTLFLHPNTKCVGIFPDEVNAWQGSVQSFQIDEFAEDGLTLGATFLPPGILALALPFYGREMDRIMQQYNHLSVWGVLVEDSHPGRLRFSPKGLPMATYKLTRADTERFKFGILKLADLFFEAGATEVLLPIRGMEYARSRDDLRQLERYRLKAEQLSLFSVHLMGTCRMGLFSRTSVVDVHHRVHGLRNVFITDASVFPGPIRVNPMLTIMAMATRAAQNFVEHQRRFSQAA